MPDNAVSNPYADRFADPDEPIRVCGVPDHYGASGDCRWPDGNIPWTIVDLLPGLTLDQMKAVASTAFARLAAVCGITPVYTDTARDARVLLGTRSIDGPASVLAESELPCGQTKQCRQWYDSGERWGVFDGQGQGIDLTRVMAHEIMHALGVQHLPAGSPNLIAPTYSQTIIRPQAGDIAELQRRYGPPKVQPPNPPSVPTPTPTPGGNPMQAFLMQMLIGFVKQWLEKAIADGTLTKILTDLLAKLGNTSGMTAAQQADLVIGHVLADPDAQAVTQALTAP